MNFQGQRVSGVTREGGEWTAPGDTLQGVHTGAKICGWI